MTSTLTQEQAEAAKNIKDFLRHPVTPGDFFCLTGPPGSGKTYMLKEALAHERRNIVGGTISHAAKHVLSESVSPRPCFTVAQLLGKIAVGDAEELRFINKGKKKIVEADILLLDEVSMIDDSEYNAIMSEVIELGIHLIVVGDPYQLPPVKQEHESKFFDRIDAELTTSQRFEGPIGELAVRVREEIRKIKHDEPFNKYLLDEEYSRKGSMVDGTGFKFENNIYHLVDAVAEDITRYRGDKNHARILAYKNSTIQLLNDSVRNVIYGGNSQQFEYGEIVISNGGFSSNNIGYIYNGQILTVVNSKIAKGPHDVPCVYLQLGGIPTPQSGIPVVLNTAEANAIYEKKKLELHKLGTEFGQWKQYNNFLQSFARFDYAYATSLYKAQGQTLNKVYVCEGEIMDVKPIEWKQRFQALYVAMTRARKELIIYNKNG